MHAGNDVTAAIQHAYKQLLPRDDLPSTPPVRADDITSSQHLTAQPLTWLNTSTLCPVSLSRLMSLSSSTILPLVRTRRSTALVCSSLSLQAAAEEDIVHKLHHMHFLQPCPVSMRAVKCAHMNKHCHHHFICCLCCFA